MLEFTVVDVTFSCYNSKVAQGFHGKQLAFHYLLNLKKKMAKKTKTKTNMTEILYSVVCTLFSETRC